MISINSIKNGNVIKLNGDLFTVMYFQHFKPGKGGAFVRTKLKNFKTGAVADKTFRAGETVEDVRIEEKKLQYIYNSGEDYFFMDLETYEQMPINKIIIGDGIEFLKEECELTGIYCEDKLVNVEMPNFINLKVSDTSHFKKGDTASGGSKPATLETGAVIQVPAFVNQGDVVKVDIRSRKYLERV
ncbi:elongation factor P [bacterium]|nr:elongation factor P [bacterium]